MKDNNHLSKMDISFGGTGLTDRVLLAKNLSVMQQSGLTVSESLSIAEETSRGKMKKIIEAVRKSVESGNSFADALSRFPKVFSGIFTSSVYAGETSGTLAENLKQLAEQLQKEKELNSKVKGAMFYPLVVLSAAFVMGIAMSFLVLPKIVPLFQGLKTELPASTKALISFSNFVDQHGVGLAVGIVLTISLLIWLVRQKFSHPVTHWLLLKIPVVKRIVINTNLARFARTMGTLLKSGLHIDEALDVTQKTVGNYYYQKALTNILNEVSKGTKLADNLEHYHKLFPKMASRMVMVGEESGNLEDTLIYLAVFYELEVDNSVKSLSTAIEPILLLFIGLVVGFLALSIITPIYNITGNISK